MPSTYAHYTFGRKVYQHLPEDLRRIVDTHRQLYCIGLHGPDIFFYYKALKKNPVSQLGHGMHGEPGERFFRRAAEILKKQESQEEKEQLVAYLLGFLCHFALDIRCHGYVESKIQRSGITHSEIEVEFDRYLMVERGINPCIHRLTRHIVPSEENAEAIAKVFPELTAEQVEASLKDMVFYDRLLLAPWDAKRQILYLGMKVIGQYEGMHGLVVNKEPNPDCRDSNLRLEKLMKQAVTYVQELYENYLGYLKGENGLSAEFQKDFSAGKNWEQIPVYSYEEELHYEI